MNRQRIKKPNGEIQDILTKKESEFVNGVKKKLARGKNLSSDVLRETAAEVYGAKAAEQGYGTTVLSRPVVQKALDLDDPKTKDKFTNSLWQGLDGTNPLFKNDPAATLACHLASQRILSKVFIAEKTESMVTNAGTELTGLSIDELKVVTASVGKIIPVPGQVVQRRVRGHRRLPGKDPLRQKARELKIATGPEPNQPQKEN